MDCGAVHRHAEPDLTTQPPCSSVLDQLSFAVSSLIKLESIQKTSAAWRSSITIFLWLPFMEVSQAHCEKVTGCVGFILHLPGCVKSKTSLMIQSVVFYLNVHVPVKQSPENNKAPLFHSCSRSFEAPSSTTCPPLRFVLLSCSARLNFVSSKNQLMLSEVILVVTGAFCRGAAVPGGRRKGLFGACFFPRCRSRMD